MRYIDKIVLSQIMPWHPNRKIYEIEKIIFWNIVKFTPIRAINFFLSFFLSSKGRNPYVQLNDDYKCIFIHIPKNAGRSVQKIFFPNYPDVGHNSLLHYKLYNNEKFNNYFKFAFVRNPWDRLVSAYHFLVKGGLNSNEPVAKRWSENLKNTGIENFESFVLSMSNPHFSRYFLNMRHLRPQHLWITDENGNLALDFVGRVETFDKDMKIIKDQLKIRSKYQQVKVNVTDHDNYKNLYTDRMKEIVSEFYKKDIEMFDYNFEGVNR